MLIALTRAVPHSIASCELTHLVRQPIDYAVAVAQHDLYEAMLASLGCTVERLPDEPGMPDSVFVEDTAIILDELAVMTRPGAESRRAEVATAAAILGKYLPLRYMGPHGTLDGGDVLRLGRTLFVGLSGRTSDGGIKDLQRLVEPHGYSVIRVVFNGCLHLKSAVTEIAPEVLLLNPDWVDARQFGAIDSIEVDAEEPGAGNALRIGDSVVCAAEFPRTVGKVERSGLAVRVVEAGELAKAEGGLTCGSLIVARP
ncbi:MAG: arginine deiminase family protein [Acidobacteriota bacterium]